MKPKKKLRKNSHNFRINISHSLSHLWSHRMAVWLAYEENTTPTIQIDRRKKTRQKQNKNERKE